MQIAFFFIYLFIFLFFFYLSIFFLFINLFFLLTVGASRLIEAQMDLPRLLFGVGLQIFIVTSQMF